MALRITTKVKTVAIIANIGVEIAVVINSNADCMRKINNPHIDTIKKTNNENLMFSMKYLRVLFIFFLLLV